MALREVDALAPELETYHLFHAIRGSFLLELGRREQARAAEMRALALTGNQAEQLLLHQRLAAWDTEETTPYIGSGPLRPERNGAGDAQISHR
jgi:predicted RNA polymerase sigma factor